jgi:acyl-coenzyme A synthetase/AMP-(fatty) acid ligase
MSSFDPTTANLAEVFAATARRLPDKHAICTAWNKVTYAQLDGAAGRAAIAFAAAGFGPGMAVALAPMRSNPLRMAATLGLARLGVAQLSLRPLDMPPEAFGVLRKRHQVVGMVVGPEGPQVRGIASVAMQMEWLAPADRTPPPAATGPDLPLQISRSSGTTGIPKAFILPQRAQLARGTLQQHPALVFREDDRAALPTGSRDPSGMSAALHMLVAGATMLVPPEPTGPTALQWLSEAGTTYLLATPPHLGGLVDAAEARGQRRALPALRVLRAWTSALSPKLIAQTTEWLTPSIHMAYGTNETGGLSVAGPEELALNPATVGRLFPGVTMEIVDAAGQPVPDGTVGEVRVKAPGLVAGYLDDPEATARAFRGDWFYPGDRAVRDAAGLLYLKGRVDELINYSGVLVSPEDIEAVLQTHPAVAEVAVFAWPDERHQEVPVAAVVLRGKVEGQEMMRFARQRLANRAPAAIVAVQTLPRNELGKVQRSQLAELCAKWLKARQAPDGLRQP